MRRDADGGPVAARVDQLGSPGENFSRPGCVDGRGGTAALVRAANLLHQIRGALLMTETYGAALLVEEMEAACKYLATLRDGKGREDGLDALTRAMVQLPLYIERLLNGSRDIALVLLPLLNDLRAARGDLARLGETVVHGPGRVPGNAANSAPGTTSRLSAVTYEISIWSAASGPSRIPASRLSSFMNRDRCF